MKKYCIYITLLLIFNTGCQLVGRKLLGIKKEKKTSFERIEKFSTKYGIPLSLSYTLNAKKYWSSVKKYKQNDSLLLNYLLQPMQIRVFDSTSSISFILFSCIMPSKGFNIIWQDSAFNSYPPKVESWKYSLIEKYSHNIENELSYIEKLKGVGIDTAFFNTKSPIIVYWSIFGGRQSKNMINEMENYRKKFIRNEKGLIYVNIDNLYFQF